ncbi:MULTISPECIES: enoyl-CoA hydratase/isomerase family protein [unclassified Chelatococcus]|uniref:enoyl-CoA hydratase/isomerase family protein n=1 Tax=unclassified Chelatococcus TaxID=2638111 RepID=UPI001BCBC085|nr:MULTISPECIES: enoyl-CoA hydratase/isomerase family protein [unclassified Chelatococcus]MBS7697635.1 enoyl-CoA hydratase/isomerase family protein [Chelatococcus sp. YT9]MBX3559009.1 enoyl-CoA hydratase/isomerase family protein [Chelatococcus sp.]
MSHVDLSVEDAVAVLRISNPPHGYMNDSVTDELHRALRRTIARPDVKVIVLTGGEPDVFIQHFDLHDVEAVVRKLNERGDRFGDGAHVPERAIDVMLRRIDMSPKPVIAAINGNAMGGGLELALACDFRLAQDGDYLIGLPEIRIGALPGAGGTQRLARIVGPARALDLVLHGRRLSPREALAAGIVIEVTDGPVLERAMERARDLASIPSNALASVKRLIRETAERPLYEGLDVERTLFMDLLAQPEALEMVSALNARGGDFRTV